MSENSFSLDITVYHNLQKGLYEFSCLVQDQKLPPQQAVLIVKISMDASAIAATHWEVYFLDRLRQGLKTYSFTDEQITQILQQANAIIAKAPYQSYNMSGVHKTLHKTTSSGTFKSHLEWKTLHDQYIGEYKATYKQGDVSSMASKLPAMNTKVEYPCECKAISLLSVDDNMKQEFRPMPQAPLKKLVIHLNDIHRWTRERIADWMDELHDAGIINIEFDVETISDEEIKEFVSEGGEK